uniref:Uncharacterized protein n=1 Tax=Acrobeloides nanus TaxID=290746 RepID=A0A914DNZ6_9BILA
MFKYFLIFILFTSVASSSNGYLSLDSCSLAISACAQYCQLSDVHYRKNCAEKCVEKYAAIVCGQPQKVITARDNIQTDDLRLWLG